MNSDHPSPDHVSGPCFPPRPSDFRHANRKRSGSRIRVVAFTGGLLLAAGTLTVPAKDFLFGPAQQRSSNLPALRLALGSASAPAPQKSPGQTRIRSEVNLAPIAPPLYITTADLQPRPPEPQRPSFTPVNAPAPAVAAPVAVAENTTSASDHAKTVEIPVVVVPPITAVAPLDTGSIQALPGNPTATPGSLPTATDLTVRFAALRTQPAPVSPTARVAALGNVVHVPDAAVPAPRIDSDRLLTRAQALIADGDISGARLMLERALADGSDRAAFQLAETYDPRMLLEWKVFGLAANTARARELYGLAADRGVSAAKERLVGLE